MAGDSHADLDPVAVFVPRRLDREIARIVFPVLRMLDAVTVDGLREIALPVEQSHGEETGVLVAGGFAIVARQDTQAAGVNREAFVKTVLGAEIGDRGFGIGRRLLGEVGIEGFQCDPIAGQVHGIPRRLVQGPLGDAPQEHAWVAAALLPELRVQILEQRPGRAVPAEKQVAREFREPGQRRRDDGRDFQ